MSKLRMKLEVLDEMLNETIDAMSTLERESPEWRALDKEFGVLMKKFEKTVKAIKEEEA